MLLEHYHIISPDDALNFSVGNYEFPNDKPGILLTFDDGLSDHFDASEILHQYGLTALLFLPTCALIDGLPANPNIVHYCVAKYGVQRLLAHYDDALDLLKVTDPNFPNTLRTETRDRTFRGAKKKSKLFNSTGD